MASSTLGKYKIKNTSAGEWVNPPAGVHILNVDGFDSLGKALNVYIEQWMDGSVDFEIAMMDGDNSTPVIVRENVDITVVFIVGQRYTETQIDTQTQYDAFVSYMTSTDVWIASTYTNKKVHCVCIDGVSPRTVKLKRGNNSYILGEIKLKALEKPSTYITQT